MKKNVCFFNHWHNGDVFSGKGYIREIIKANPDVKYSFYHGCHPKVIWDLLPYFFDTSLNIENHLKFIEIENTTFVNTWIGAYKDDVLLPGELHGNYLSFYKMWGTIFDYLRTNNGMNLELSNNPLDYVATTDWSRYKIERANEFITYCGGKKIYLFSNGYVRATQTFVGNMRPSIEHHAKLNPDAVFVCTEWFETAVPNIYFTRNIFDLDNDINEIVYLSTKCNAIIGKSSGPFTYAHVRDNLFDTEKVMLVFSHRMSDCFPHHMSGLGCRYLYCSSDDENDVCRAIEQAIRLSERKIIQI